MDGKAGTEIRETETRETEIREVDPGDIDSVNIMCTMPGSDPREVLRESAQVHQHVAALGVRTFGAFRSGKPVARLEIMPIDAAPLALVGDGLWVIRCLWVLEEAQGSGIARLLMERALGVARGSKGIAVVTYENWMPASFFEKFGFEVVETKGKATLLLKKMRPEAAISFAPILTGKKTNRGRMADEDAVGVRIPAGGQPAEEGVVPARGHRETAASAGGQPAEDGAVRVEAVFTGRCPWLMQSWRHWLKVASEISDKVLTSEKMILTRADAMRFGDENIYIDGVPYEGFPIHVESFRKAIQERLAAKGLT
ncbi:MAG TPA: GNAT family N-acetyltransferase [Firmicutes bacterium]|nr:GNAT family N-acetyltransferase [Candidatus Fermentithermobacillaceae bacterium]